MSLLCHRTPGLFEDLIKEKCQVDIRIVSGANCCRIRGVICGVQSQGRVLLVIDCKTNSQCLIPVDKVAVICKVCPTTRRRGLLF